MGNQMLMGGKLIDGATISVDVTSDTMLLEGIRNASLHMVSASGTRAGKIEVFTSNDNANWALVTLADGTTQVDVTASTALNEMVDLFALGGRFLRVKYTSTTGTGTLTVTAAPKPE